MSIQLAEDHGYSVRRKKEKRLKCECTLETTEGIITMSKHFDEYQTLFLAIAAFQKKWRCSLIFQVEALNVSAYFRQLTG